MKTIVIGIIAGVIGITIGGYLFADTQPRSFLKFQKCAETCLDSNELLGLIASVGIEKIPAGVSIVAIRESEKSVVIEHPFPQADLHYVAIPKKDIKDPADLTEEDEEYLADMYALFGDIIREKSLYDYKIITNGPGFQTVNYLHFHLVADIDK